MYRIHKDSFWKNFKKNNQNGNLIIKHYKGYIEVANICFVFLNFAFFLCDIFTFKQIAQIFFNRTKSNTNMLKQLNTTLEVKKPCESNIQMRAIINWAIEKCISIFFFTITNLQINIIFLYSCCFLFFLCFFCFFVFFLDDSTFLNFKIQIDCN